MDPKRALYCGSQRTLWVLYTSVIAPKQLQILGECVISNFDEPYFYLEK